MNDRTFKVIALAVGVIIALSVGWPLRPVAAIAVVITVTLLPVMARLDSTFRETFVAGRLSAGWFLPVLLCVLAVFGAVALKSQYVQLDPARGDVYYVPVVSVGRRHGDIWWVFDRAREQTPERRRDAVRAIDMALEVFGPATVRSKLALQGNAHVVSLLIIGLVLGVGSSLAVVLVYALGSRLLARSMHGVFSAPPPENGPVASQDEGIDDFYVVVDGGSKVGEYRVRVDSAPVESRPIEDGPFPYDEVERTRLVRSLSVTVDHRNARPPFVDEDGSVVDKRVFGKQLSDWLIRGTVRDCYAASWAVSKIRGRTLRVRLWVRSPELSVLPWEFLFDVERDNYFVLLTPPLVRVSVAVQVASQITLPKPLHVVAMCENVPGMKPLMLNAEKEWMKDALRPLIESGDVVLRWVQGPSRDDLQKALLAGPCHVFHFAGHGVVDTVDGHGGLMITDGEAAASSLTGRDLVASFGASKPLLVVLNSCEGAMACPLGTFSSVAEALAKNNVPAVVAMQYVVSDKAAIHFAAMLYGGLAKGIPIDSAVTVARNAIKWKGQMPEWATPVLYLNSRTGYLFVSGSLRG